MDEHTIMTLVTVLSGGGGAVAWYKVFTERKQVRETAKAAREQLVATAETERQRIVAEAQAAAASTALNCWRDFTKALQERLAVVTGRMDELQSEVDELKQELATERAQRGVLEDKVKTLEAERVRLQSEREALLQEIETQRKRIDELEGKG